MNSESLEKLGLTKPQAKAYISLIKEGNLTPPALANKIKESRSNTYKILDRLIELGLVTRREEQKKFVYRPESPVALERLARDARNEALAHEKQIKDHMPTLLSYFYTFSEQPGIRFFRGEAGIKEVFNDIVRTGKTQYLLRSPSDISFYDSEFFANLRKKKVKAGIQTIALTPNVSSANHDPSIDAQNNLLRTWLPKNAYTANVEWSTYGDKVAIISYGHEAIATIIESPQIAEGFRQVFNLVHQAQQSAPNPVPSQSASR
jgi:sugar-specific transcriptional regulator TrmB